jgi:hypothetical protein
MLPTISLNLNVRSTCPHAYCDSSVAIRKAVLRPGMRAEPIEGAGNGNLALLAHLIETVGEKQGGRLGNLLQQLGKMQRQLEMQRTTVSVSIQVLAPPEGLGLNLWGLDNSAPCTETAA